MTIHKWSKDVVPPKQKVEHENNRKVANHFFTPAARKPLKGRAISDDKRFQSIVMHSNKVSGKRGDKRSKAHGFKPICNPTTKNVSFQRAMKRTTRSSKILLIIRGINGFCLCIKQLREIYQSRPNIDMVFYLDQQSAFSHVYSLDNLISDNEQKLSVTLGSMYLVRRMKQIADARYRFTATAYDADQSEQAAAYAQGKTQGRSGIEGLYETCPRTCILIVLPLGMVL